MGWRLGTDISQSIMCAWSVSKRETVYHQKPLRKHKLKHCGTAANLGSMRETREWSPCKPRGSAKSWRAPGETEDLWATQWEHQMLLLARWEIVSQFQRCQTCNYWKVQPGLGSCSVVGHLPGIYIRSQVGYPALREKLWGSGYDKDVQYVDRKFSVVWRSGLCHPARLV